MDIYKLKFTTLQNEIFRLFCIKAGATLNQRQVARLLKVSATAVGKSIKMLEEEGLIKLAKSKTMNLTSIEFNRNNPKAIALKRVENLKLVYESGLADFLEESFPGCAVILFGSYSLGEDIENSDIDIAVIGSKEKRMELKRFDKLLERTIYIHFYENIAKINKHLRSNILNGISLTGAIEL